jgi:hypothetical protein
MGIAIHSICYYTINITKKQYSLIIKTLNFLKTAKNEQNGKKRCKKHYKKNKNILQKTLDKHKLLCYTSGAFRWNGVFVAE